MASNGEEAPSWITDDAPAPAPAPAPASAPAPAAAPAAAPRNEDPTTLEDTQRDQLRGVILFTRLLNLGISIAVIVHAIFCLVGLPRPKFWILGLYSLIFGQLICCLETQLKFVRTFIAMHFGFLFDPILRFMFYMLIATVEFSFKTLWGHILAGSLVGIALYNTFVLFKYPAYRRLRDQIAEDEDRRIEGKIREKIRKEATAAMFKGGN